MLADFRIQCTTAEHGYTVGDEVGLGSLQDAARLPTFSVSRLDATAVVNTGWVVGNKTTGAAANLTAGRWKYRVVSERGW
jgi:hypothetical protein